ncbi:MAG: hypothetical protein AB1782_04525 [Cyanobacteriota bacterium]
MIKFLKRLIILILPLLIMYVSILQILGANIPAEVENYSSFILEIKKSKVKQSLHRLYELGLEAQSKIDGSFDKKTYELICRKMEGFQSFPYDQNEYEPGIYLDPDYFLNLASNKGIKEDIIFFELYKKTKPSGLFSSYIAQQTDYSGCYLYGNGLMVELYENWSSFANSYPNTKVYKNFASKVISDIERVLTSNTPCVCKNKGSYVHELQYFIKKFPDSKLVHKLKTLINKAEKGYFDSITEPRKIFYCHSG